MLKSHGFWRLPAKQLDSCAHTLCWRAVLLKLKLVLFFRLYKEYVMLLVGNLLRYTCAKNYKKCGLV